MLEVATEHPASPATRRAARSLVERVTTGHGKRPLSDEHWLAIAPDGDAPDAVVVTARAGAELVAFAQAVPGNDAHSLELVAGPDGQHATRSVLAAALRAVRVAGGGPVHYWISAPSDADDADARSAGLVPTRRLWQMRRAPLPTGLPVDVETRAFRPAIDEAAWLEVNNRAFAAHPEQGAWTAETLARREAEPWFDPEGFRLHDRDGRLAAFCWTKLHDDHDPVLGEIYVIAVDPDFQGLGLGRRLTLAGLDWIATHGVGVGMLYVDESNTGAVALYEALGFGVHHVDVAYAADVRTEP